MFQILNFNLLIGSLWTHNSEEEDYRVAAALSDEKEGYGGPKQGLNISLTPKTFDI